MRVARIDSSGSGFGFQITASFGVSSTATSKFDLDKLLSQADQALYRAKREGRNRVRTLTQEMLPELVDHAARHAPRRDAVAAPADTNA